MSVTQATPQDLPYIVALSKKHAEELGFLPREAMAQYMARRQIELCRENGDPCGYFLHGPLTRHVRIFQACVQYDARGLHHGLAMLSRLVTVAAHHGTRRISLHCRDGLAANSFWSACGFQGAGLLLGGNARRRIIHVWELDIAAALCNPTLPYSKSFLAGIRPGESAGTRTPESSCIT